LYPDTYSQYDEQQAILGFFGTAYPGRLGRFLDVGAWDPKTFSKTRALFELGWRGVLIDPSPYPLVNLIAEYGTTENMHIVSAAVAVEATMLKLHVSQDSISTTEQEHFETWETKAKYEGVLWVRSITMDDIFSQFGGFDFINLDAEGVSVDLFHQMLKSGGKPPCCCVEHDNRLAELAAAATAVGYRLIYSNGTNAVFTR
jgi:FkbM family methyltransferase